MASVGGFDAVGTFVARLEPNLVGSRRLRRRLAEEMRGHLEDATERYRARGMTSEAAQHKAIEDFGPPEVVVGGWAESKGVGVPTTFTRYSGLAGLIGALGLAASLIYQSVSLKFSQGAFAEVSLSFLALIAISFAGLYMRVRGKLVSYARLGPWVAMSGFIVCVVGSAMWFAPLVLVGFLAILTGLGTYFVGAIRSGIVPRGPIALWIAGIAGTLLIGLVTMLIDFDPGVALPLIGLSAFAVGWAWLGLHLWSEEPADKTTEAPA
ncbi:MAG: permease prefix domain 1-containing protein [Actinomycetota bacterium]